MDSIGLPTAENDINKTKFLLTDILKLNDSSYADINASAAYLLATYYGDKRYNKDVELDYKKSKYYLELSKKWAQKYNDIDLEEKINKNIQYIEKILQEK